MMTLFNVSINKKGALHIQLSESGVLNILKCFEDKNTVDIQTLAIQLLLSLLEEIPTQEYRVQIATKVRMS